MKLKELTSKSNTFRFEKNGLDICEDAATGLCFVNPQPSSEEISAIYDSSYFFKGNKYAPSSGSAVSPQRLNDEKRIELVKQKIPNGKLLDVGCAKGDFLSLAKESGYDVAGVELSEFAAKSCIENYSIPVEISTLEEANFEEEQFDVITLWDVIEHLPDPESTIKAANRFLKPGGYLFVSTGDISSLYARVLGKRWHLMTPPEHLFFFTPDSMKALLAENGFQAEDFLYVGKNACIDFILFKLSQSIGAPARVLRFIANKLGISGLKMYINLFDIMTCVSRKC